MEMQVRIMRRGGSCGTTCGAIVWDPTSCIRVPMWVPAPNISDTDHCSCFWQAVGEGSSSWLPAAHVRRPRWSSGVLVLARAKLSHCGHLGSNPVDGRSLSISSAFQINKNKQIRKRIVSYHFTPTRMIVFIIVKRREQLKSPKSVHR